MPPIPSFYIKEIDSIIALIFPFDPIFIDRFDLLLVVATTARKINDESAATQQINFFIGIKLKFKKIPFTNITSFMKNTKYSGINPPESSKKDLH